MIALPLEFLNTEPLEDFLKRLKEIVDSKQVGEILVGIPRNMNGTYGPAAEKAREFVAKHQLDGNTGDVHAHAGGQRLAKQEKTAGRSSRSFSERL